MPGDFVREKLRNRETTAEDHPETTATGHRKVVEGRKTRAAQKTDKKPLLASPYKS